MLAGAQKRLMERAKWVYHRSILLEEKPVDIWWLSLGVFVGFLWGWILILLIRG